MAEEGFKSFLNWNGATAGKAQNTRCNAVRKFEASLVALASPQSDLDAAYKADRFESLRATMTGPH